MASKLRFQELEDFKREREEASQAEKYRIIEKHINLDRIAQRKSLASNLLSVKKQQREIELQ